MASVRDVIVLLVVRILCDSMKIFFLYMKSSVFLFYFLDHALAKSRRQLEPFGSVGAMILQSIAAFVRIIIGNKLNVSWLSCRVSFWFFFRPLVVGFEL